MWIIISTILTMMFVVAGIILDDTKTIVHPAYWALYGYVFCAISICAYFYVTRYTPPS